MRAAWRGIRQINFPQFSPFFDDHKDMEDSLLVVRVNDPEVKGTTLLQPNRRALTKDFDQSATDSSSSVPTSDNHV